ncbi:MAG: Mrp/NBP35 family ATP-binding protein, partial [Pseudomonadota bacterium]
GILDADIYGPSQPQLLGVADQRPELRDQKNLLPIKAHGIQSMSMGYLLSENTPAVWRGPMASGALQQLIFQTDWHDLDYLFVDMPPGTGDIHLTLSQQVPVSGAVVVTTPQDIALLDAKKAIEMFAKVNTPILGVVENMAVYQCSQCGYQEHIFGEGGGARIAKDYGSQLLGALPLALAIREQADGGNPTVVADPEGDIASIYRQTAQKIAAALWRQQCLADAGPEIVISDD